MESSGFRARKRHPDRRQVSNILIDIRGDHTGSESYVTATLRMRREGKLLQMSVISRHLDRWSHRGGIWAIDHRIAVMDMDEIGEVTPMKQHERASRDRSDISFAVLRPPTA
jgi:hypothetical protein